MSFVVDRRSGDPDRGNPGQGLGRPEGGRIEADRSARPGGHRHRPRPSRKTLLCLPPTPSQFAINTPGAWNLGNDPNRKPEGLHLHRSAGVSSGRHRALQDHRARADGERLHHPARPGAKPGAARSADLRRIWSRRRRSPTWARRTGTTRFPPTPALARTTSPCSWATATSKAPASRSRTTRSRNTR